MSKVLTAEERLFLTNDGKVVREGDYRAAFLLAPKGEVIPAKTAERFGLTKGIKIEPLEKAPIAATARTIAPEVIESRSTRPETPSSKR